MKKSIRKFLILMGVMCLVLGLCTLVACNKSTDSSDTTTAPATEAPTETEVVTEAPTTAESVEESSEEATALESDSDSEATSETEETTTESTLPKGAPTDATVVTFCDIPGSTALSTSSAAKYEIVDDGENGTALKLSVTQIKKNAVPYFKLEYAAYMKLVGLEPATWNDCSYALVQVKLDGVSGGAVKLAASGRVDGANKTVNLTANYNSTSDWQYLLFPISEESGEGMLTSLRIDFSENPKTVGEAVYIKSITFFDNKLDAVELMGTDLIKPGEATVIIPGLTKEYKFLHITDTHVSAFGDSDKGSWTATRLNYNLARRAAFVADGLYAEERFPLFFKYADSIGADGMFLTGDLIDFPSEKNVSMLYQNATSINGKAIFCLGNHDWNYSDDYMTSNAYATYKPLFSELCGGDPDISVLEYDEFLVVALDNSADVVTDATVQKFFALYEKNKPIILLLHVPLHADTLAPDVKNAWGGRNITMGIGAMGNDWQSVRDLYTSVCLDENTPVVAVFSGHVHFNHVDTFPNGVTQYVTNAGYFGDCRVITVKGAN